VLSPTTTYYFRIAATNSVGTNYGNNQTFTTASPPPIAIGGYNHCLVIKPDGTLWGWGGNTSGQLGQGNTVSPQYTPVQIGVDNNWKVIAAGGATSGGQGCSFGIKTNGTLWAWGLNSGGQLGLGNTTSPISVTTQVGADTNWQTVTAGTDHVLAIKTDGTLWAWGANNNGQLGRGDTVTPQTSPIQIGSDTWRAIAAGSQFSLAIKTDGTLWAWGYNGSGQLGRGDTVTPQLTPVQIGADTWSAVEASRYGTATFSHGLGIKTDGTLWSWGNNQTYGQLGLGNTTSPISVTTQVITPTGTWRAIKAGGRLSFAIKDDGTLRSCGYNIFGSLGRSGGTTLFRQVGTTNDWRSLASGLFNTISVRFNNSQYEIWGWGSGEYGSLDSGGYYEADTPVKLDIDISGETGNWIRSITHGITTSPPARSGHSMVWDGNKVIMFGGANNDTWWYYPVTNTWAQQFPSGGLPVTRSGQSMVWDGNKVIMFGGAISDTWWYYPVTNTWTQQFPAGGLPVTRSGQSMVWDGNKVIMFGGVDNNWVPISDTWWYYPVTNTWVQQTPIGGPPPARSGQSMVWDGNKVIMFGGSDNNLVPISDTWWYYPVTNTWAQQTTSGPPPARSGQSMIWDGTRAIMFGGSDNNGVTNDTWWYDPAANTWTLRTNIGDIPLARNGHTMIWDGTRGIMFGGYTDYVDRNDLWWYSP
jgi:alpha-tubulin suppressor-like RCC1 family protein